VNADAVKTIASEWMLSHLGKMPHVGDLMQDGLVWRVPINIDIPVCGGTDTLRFRNVGEIMIHDAGESIMNVSTVEERESRMSEEIGRLLAEIRNAIPSSDCARCGACCGPLGATQMEADLIDEYVRRNHIEVPEFAQADLSTSTIMRVVDGGMCPYLQDQECVVYDVRPTICWLFGNVNAFMVCKVVGTHKAAITHKAALCILDKVDALSSLWVAICNRSMRES